MAAIVHLEHVASRTTADTFDETISFYTGLLGWRIIRNARRAFRMTASHFLPMAGAARSRSSSVAAGNRAQMVGRLNPLPSRDK